MKIVVASDRQTAGNIVRGALQQAPDAEAARVIDVARPDQLDAALCQEAVVLVDWDLEPEIGRRFVVAAREASADTPVLLLCPRARMNTTRPALQAGAAGVVQKPFTPEELLAAIAKARNGSTAGKRSAVNVEFINPFIEATKTVFATMCNLEVDRKKLFLKTDYAMFGDISGVMGLSGTASGAVVISLPKDLACLVVGNMLGEPPAATLDESVRDGVGELINMISGHAKAALTKTKYHFAISLPSVVSGAGHEISHKKGTPNIVVLFQAQTWEFAIQVCLAPSEE